jgi:hypothetical protein
MGSPFPLLLFYVLIKGGFKNLAIVVEVRFNPEHSTKLPQVFPISSCSTF